MDQQTHFADPSSLKMALMAGLVYQPHPEWDFETGTWVVLARPRQGGSFWVLTREGAPVAYRELDSAQREAAGFADGDSLYTVGRR